MSNYTILELFRQEVENNVAIIKKCLSELKNQSFSMDEIAAAIQATHSLWGTTSIVEMETAANLVNLIKDSFIAVQKQHIFLETEDIDVLLHASDLLLSMSQVDEDNLDTWISDRAWDWKTTQKTITNLLMRGKEKADSETVVENNEPQVNNQENNDPSLIVLGGMNSNESSIIDLFRLEAEEQVKILNDGLLMIENQPQSIQELESLMRAAHSIKGAARIVGFNAVVELAHAMEDCFVAAQNQTIILLADDVDILLQGVDFIENISQLSYQALPNWLAQNQANLTNICNAIQDILKPGSQQQQKQVQDQMGESATSNSKSLVPIPAQSPLINFQLPNVNSGVENTNKNQNRVVRLSADNLNRIMGLAGESLMEANWLQPFADSMMSLKSQMLDISRKLELLEEALEQNLSIKESREYLTQARQQKQECLHYIGDRLEELELYVRRTASLSDRLYREVINSHLRPFADGLQGFPRMIRDLARSLNKQVNLEIIGQSTPVDRDILSRLEAPITHILRNAVDHGIELPEERIAYGKPPQGTIRLEAVHRGGMLAITISDDGRGINCEKLRQKVISKNLVHINMATKLSDAELIEFLFLPGFSTAQELTEISGRGVGLDIAKSMAQEVGGTVRATSQLGKGTSFYFQLPLTLSVVRTLLVEITDKPYAIPLARIEQIITLDRSEINNIENHQYFTMNNKNIGLIPAYQVLELPSVKQQNSTVHIVVISEQNSIYGLVVDKFLCEKDLVVRPLDPRLGKVPDISATALLADGSPILILDVSDIVRSIDAILKQGKLSTVMMQAELEKSQKQPRILVVDDSITVREMERKLLENRGYLVDTAVNGVEGWNAIRTNNYDLVISDIDMPRMNGIELVKQIKSNPRFNSLPVIIISYRDREEDKILGLEAGADYYLTKSSFHDETLINAVIDLIGE